jgi:two-component system chemotaxis response regulator CheB
MIRVLIVDDSLTVRRILTRELGRFDDIEVIGSAEDAYRAREMIAERRPDVVTLDLEMPRMGGLAFLEKLMAHYPLPVVVVSALTPENSEMALRAFHLGAVEVVSKPGPGDSAPDVRRRLVRAVRAAASARVRAPDTRIATAPTDWHPGAAHRIVAIGASTGGTRAIEDLLSALPADVPGIVIAQHLPAAFTQSFARRLDSRTALTVREAGDGDVVAPGLALVAPGGRHMLVEREGDQLRVHFEDRGDRIYCPSIDVLLASVAAAAGAEAVGVLLTGMGADGARGLLAMRSHGAFTVAEARETCVVWGMPRAAAHLGAATEIAPLYRIPEVLLEEIGRPQCAPVPDDAADP